MLNIFKQYIISNEDMFFIGMCIVFVIEQVFYRLLGSYPYKYGLIVKSIDTKLTAGDNILKKDAIKYSGLSIKISNDNMLYFHKKYTISILAPLLFCGSIKLNKISLLTIRIGPITAIFILYLMINPIFTGAYYHIIDSVFIFIIVVLLYYRFNNLCKNTFS